MPTHARRSPAPEVPGTTRDIAGPPATADGPLGRSTPNPASGARCPTLPTSKLATFVSFPTDRVAALDHPPRTTNPAAGRGAVAARKAQRHEMA
ncbi:hypothetical protein GCM10023107_43140 [Actinoplanes octamycinicus]|nr:hypothetical protein Aoc01nite_56270 [Actinoplanes octamycinicus]